MDLLSELFYLDRSLLADDNEKALSLIAEYVPLKIHRFKSGTKCFDWTIPQKWKLNKAVLTGSDGKAIIDASENILHVVNYSCPFKGVVAKEFLLKHLHFEEAMPDVIPYRTSYYSGNWGFCISYDDFKKLSDEMYYVDIDTEFERGELLIGEAVIEGETDREIVLSSHYCHPRQANDGLSGVIALVKLYDMLKNRKNKYTYRFFFAPETIGAIALLSHGTVDPKKVEYALVVTCVGHGERFHYKRTYRGSHAIDSIFESIDCIKVAFHPTGGDERQYSSPKIRIPTGVFTRTPYEKFNEYHTSADNLDFVSANVIKNSANVLYRALVKYEQRECYLVTHDGCEPMLSKKSLYRQIGVPGHTDVGKIRNWIIFLSDGMHTISDITKISGFDPKAIKYHIEILIKNDVIRKA